MNFFQVRSFLPKAIGWFEEIEISMGRGGGLLLYVKGNIPSMLVNTVFQRKIKSSHLKLVFLIKSGCFYIYKPPAQNGLSFLYKIKSALNLYSK